ncbi:MAG TPA: hypothetical protein VL907_08375 [Pyrinomonadaceae bacterium]|jgi:hypothetical protein|nr:hypothetical protein [Pyrinomonadaceae bacterium]
MVETFIIVRHPSPLPTDRVPMVVVMMMVMMMMRVPVAIVSRMRAGRAGVQSERGGTEQHHSSQR